MPLLRYLDESGAVRMKEVGDEPVVIGRAPTCQVILDSDMISREHARIERAADGRYSIRDLGSRNKTHVDGQLITDTILRGGDVIRLGDRVVEFLEDAGPREKIELDFLTPDNKEPPDCEWAKIKAPLSLTIQQIEELSRLPGTVRLTTRPEDIADAALSQVMLDLGAERGFIALRGEGKRDLLPIAQRGLKKTPTGAIMPVSQSFVFASILQSVAGRYPKSAGSIDPKAGFAGAGLVAPLTHRGEIVGLIYIDRPTTKKPFATTGVHQLAAAGALIGAMMAEVTRKLTESAQREGVAWLTTVRRVQQTLGSPTDSSDAFAVRAKRLPGRLRCGDLCEVIHLDEQRVAIVLVDGGGRGMSGLAQAASIRSGIRAALAVSSDALMDPQAMFHALNEIAASSPARQAVPCTYLGIDLAAGKIAYINAAGMPPVVMVAPGRLVTMDQPSLVLGVDRTYIYETTFVDIPEKFRVVCFSDGLPEAPNVSGEALTNAKIHEALLEHEAFKDADAVIDRIDKLMAAHLPGGEPEDDASVVVVARG